MMTPLAHLAPRRRQSPGVAVLVALLHLGLTAGAHSATIVEVVPTTSGTFAVAVTTDALFDTLIVGVDGDVAGGVNLVPPDDLFGTRQIASTTSGFRLLSPLGSPESDGVFEPGLSHAIDLTYGVTTPTPGEWIDGLDAMAFLGFQLPGRQAEASVRVLYRGATIEMATAVLDVANRSGDFDGDGHVDGRDFLVWQRDTSVGNLTDWQTNFGANSTTATAVPEPNAVMLALMGFVAALASALRSQEHSIAIARRSTDHRETCR